MEADKQLEEDVVQGQGDEVTLGESSFPQAEDPALDVARVGWLSPAGHRHVAHECACGLVAHLAVFVDPQLRLAAVLHPPAAVRCRRESGIARSVGVRGASGAAGHARQEDDHRIGAKSTVHPRRQTSLERLRAARIP